MAIFRLAYDLLCDEALRRPFSGNAVTLGRQHVDVFPYSDELLFRELGFESVESIDVSDFEGASHVLDLNLPVPTEFEHRFDFVFDGGTLEHVFRIPTALASIHRMLKPGGRVMHMSPVNNHVDHGFWQFGPTLFADYYSANEWDLDVLALYRHRAGADSYRLYAYDPDHVGQHSMGGFDGAMWGVCCVATKTASARSDVIPQQYAFRRLWGAEPWMPDSDRQRRVAWLEAKSPTVAALARRVVREQRALRTLRVGMTGRKMRLRRIR